MCAAGKSHLAGLLVEPWIAAGYVVLVVDMEGEHVALHRLRTAIVLDDQPSARELLALLGQRSLSVVLDLSGLKPPEKIDYLRTLPAVVEAQRAAWGLPHWIVVDEAHATLGEGGVAAGVFRPADRGYCLVTYHPEQLCADALAAPLPAHRRFQFRQPDGAVIATADDLAEFGRLLGSVDAGVLAHHLEHGDFSRWITGTIQDRQLGAVAGAIERDLLAHRAADVVHARQRLLDELESRYLAEP